MRQGSSSVFINAFLDFPNMFQQVIAIVRGSLFPQKLLKLSVLWMDMDYGPSRVVSCRGMFCNKA
jgi:hypothetical protein